MLPKTIKPEVSVIIPTKNGIERISRCLNSIKKQTFKNWEAIVIDDGSDDGTPELIKKDFKCFKVITSKKGLCENRNIGIRNSSGKYIVMIDDDAYLEKDWIKKMEDFMDKHANVAMACGKILLDENTIFSAGVRISKTGNGYDIGNRESSKNYNNIKKIHYANTTSLIARKKIIEEVGLFDKVYFFGYEDMDLGWRCNIAGFDVFYYPEAISYHPPKKLKYRVEEPYWRTYLFKRAKIMTLFKNYQLGTLIKLLPVLFSIFIYNIIFKKDRIQIIKAYLWSILNIRHIIKERRRINLIRKKTDNELFNELNWSLI